MERFRITEINARFSFNAFILGMLAHEGLRDMGVGGNGLELATNPEKVTSIPHRFQMNALFLTSPVA
jgi:hypothetical protein